MSRIHRARSAAALVLTALLLPLLAWVAPAQADDPAATGVPTTVRLFRSDGAGARTIGIDARVRSASGAVPTGTVTFYLNDSSTPYDDPVTLDAGGHAKIVAGIPFCGPFGCTTDVWRAVYTPTGDFAASEGTDGDGLPITVVGQPTILGLGGPSLLTLPLTTAVRVFYSDGIPAEGAVTYFSYGSDPRTSPNPLPEPNVCFAYVDKDGLATCKGKGTAAAIVSLLGTGTYATVYPTAGDLASIKVVKLPVIAVLK